MTINAHVRGPCYSTDATAHDVSQFIAQHQSLPDYSPREEKVAAPLRSFQELYPSLNENAQQPRVTSPLASLWGFANHIALVFARFSHARHLSTGIILAAGLVAGPATAQTLGTPGDGEMPYTAPVHANQVATPPVPADGQILYPAPVIPALASSVVLTHGAPLQILGADFVNNESGDGTIGYGGSVTISFVNTADVAASDVIFDLESGNQFLGNYDLHGLFSPGVKIEHKTFGTPAAYGPEQLNVAEIDFSNGSVWRNQQQLLERRQAGS